MTLAPEGVRMFGSTTLDVMIGLFFLYFVLSVVSSAIMEAISATLALRAKTLHDAIDGLLDGLNIDVTEFFKSPHIAPLALEDLPEPARNWCSRIWARGWAWLWERIGACPGRGRGIPTYIPADRFTTALLSLLDPQAEAGESAAIHSAAPPQFERLAAAVAAPRVFKRSKPAAKPLGAAAVAAQNCATSSETAAGTTAAAAPGGATSGSADNEGVMKPAFAPASSAAQLFVANTEAAIPDDASDADRIAHLRSQFDSWYSQTMDRANGWYKRTTQRWIFALGVVIVCFLNIDSITLMQRLSLSTNTRNALATEAVAATQQYAARTAATNPDMANQDLLHEELAEVDTAALPLGWTGEWTTHVAGKTLGQRIGYFGKKFLGLAITLFAILLGAPFWFGVLSKVVDLRNAGRVPPVPGQPDPVPPPPGPAFTVTPTPVKSDDSGGDPPPSPLPDNYWHAANRQADLAPLSAAPVLFLAGAAMARCAVLAYESTLFVRSVLQGSWGVAAGSLQTFLDAGGTQAFVFQKGDVLVVSFRGTQGSEFADIIDDACCRAVDRSADLGAGKVAIGFAASLDEKMDAIDQCVQKLAAAAKDIFVTGHSLGGALATLYASHLEHTRAATNLQGRVHLYTFGSPRVGDQAFATALENVLGFDGAQWQTAIAGVNSATFTPTSRIFRFVDHNDIVTRVPPADVFVHAGPGIYLTVDGNADLTMTQARRFDQSVIDVVSNFKLFATSSVEDHSSEKYLSILERISARA